jgi:hypothetical protein
MKKTLYVFALSILLFLPISHVFAVYVNGYYRSNGTYVNGYERTAPDGDPYNNYDYPGNYNPNTGEITGGDPSTYLNDYYKDPSDGSDYSYPSYTYPTTPSCPINSYYDGISSCTCDSGYIVSGSSCVNANLYCSDKLGVMSEYNSVSKECECMSGYTLNGNSCVSYNQSCQNQYGLNSYGDENYCYCSAGYEFNASKTACVAQPMKTNNEVCQDSFGINSNWIGTVNSTGEPMCGCGSGYQWSTNKTSCVIIPTSILSTTSESDNNEVTTNTTTQNTDLGCQTKYGSGSELQGDLCYCSKGFEWNSLINMCEIGNPVFTKYLSLGSIGSEVVNLKNFLAIQKIYTGYVNTPYDSSTSLAVATFQKMNNIFTTGNVGSKTRNAINKMNGN